MGKHREKLWKWFGKDGRATAPPGTLSGEQALKTLADVRPAKNRDISESTNASPSNLTERHVPPDLPAQVGSTNARPQPSNRPVNDAPVALTSAEPLQPVSASTVQEISNTSSSRATQTQVLPSVLHVADASRKKDHGVYFPVSATI
ncbi:hypothetical protein DL98DRAFT_600309 [Cadophora sp. DSE1049]|nr:hypothetical protein DL98DRAFT_600309 [Cadophora sp. DSE1049]